MSFRPQSLFKLKSDTILAKFWHKRLEKQNDFQKHRISSTHMKPFFDKPTYLWSPSIQDRPYLLPRSDAKENMNVVVVPVVRS